MEDISPTLMSVFEMKYALVSGDSVFNGVQKFLLQHGGLWSETLTRYLRERDKDHKVDINQFQQLHYFQYSILELLKRADTGEPALKPLVEIEKQLFQYCDLQVHEYFVRLPFKSLIPLMLLLVPAYLILLFAPLVQMLGAMGG